MGYRDALCGWENRRATESCEVEGCIISLGLVNEKWPLEGFHPHSLHNRNRLQTF